MNEFKPIPTSISHKQLNNLLTSAKKETLSKFNKLDTEEEKFKELISEWTDLSKKILSDLSSKKNHLIKDKGPNSLMALGAMEVHLNMAVQALKASEKEN